MSLLLLILILKTKEVTQLIVDFVLHMHFVVNLELYKNC